MFGPNWQEITEPGVYGRLQVLDTFGPGNPTPEELTWPIVSTGGAPWKGAGAPPTSAPELAGPTPPAAPADAGDSPAR
jgi:hypothetical protein